MSKESNTLPPLDTTRGTVLRGAAGMQRHALPPSLVVAGLAVVLGGVLSGFQGVLGALIGSVITIGGGLLVLLVMRKTAHLDPIMVMGAVMGTYFVKIAALLGFGVLFKNTTLFDIRVFAGTVVAGVLVWAVGVGVGFRRTKVLTVIPDASGPRS